MSLRGIRKFNQNKTKNQKGKENENKSFAFYWIKTKMMREKLREKKTNKYPTGKLILVSKIVLEFR